MHHILLAAQPTALLTDVPAPDQPLGQGVISTLAYFVLSMAIFGIGFIIQDLLTPGKFRKQVFVDNLPNACVLAGSQAIAIGIVLLAIFLQETCGVNDSHDDENDAAEQH